MFKRHTLGIVNAMALNKNNAMAERLNGKIQEIKLSAKGYRKFENFRTAILFFHGKLNLYPQETLQNRLKWLKVSTIKLRLLFIRFNDSFKFIIAEKSTL